MVSILGRSWSIVPFVRRLIPVLLLLATIVTTDVNLAHADGDVVSSLGLTLLSVGPQGKANGLCGESSASGDGRYVGFYSTASNLYSGDDQSDSDVGYFVKDRATGALAPLVLVDETNQKIPLRGYFIRLSGNGRFALLEAENQILNGKATALLRVDLQKSEVEIVSGNSGKPHGAESCAPAHEVFQSFPVLLPAPATD